jgi:peptide/nickel transport system ATP-binding protein
LLGLLRAPLAARAERLEFAGTDLRHSSPRAWTRLRGAGLALMPQDPRHALNPVLRVGAQFDAAVSLHGHRRMTRAARGARIGAALAAVGLAGAVLDSYPHQLSGGMGQRVVLALMLINDPRVLIADEPTAALDAERRDLALELLSGLVASRRMGLLLISHDLQRVARHCDRVLVMYRGRIVDAGAAARLPESQHPYTRLLWSCQPSAATYGTVLPVMDRAAGALDPPP